MEVPSLLRAHSAQTLLLWSALIGLLCYHIHEWTVSLPISLRFFMGVAVGITVVFLCHLSFWRLERIRKEREGYARQMTSLSKEDLFRLLPEDAAKTASSKRPDQFEWLNVELAKAWPFLNDALADLVKDRLQPVLDQYKMGALAEMKIKSMSFGTTSPQFLGVKTEEMGEDEASIEADLQWKAEREKIVVKVKTVGPDFKVKIQNIKVWTTVKLVLKPLTETLPGFGAILVSLSEVPVIEFDVKIAKGDANALPGVDKMIDSSIRTAVEDMLVWPNRIICPVLPGDYSFLELRPVGILEAFILNAEGVMNTDILGKSDCFVVLFVRKKPERIKRSTTKKNSLSPVWNEGFRIEVDDPQNQTLTVQLMDEESITKAEYIGRAIVPLSNLVPHEPNDMWLDMMESSGLQCRKPRARVHLVLVYKPFERESSESKDTNESAANEGVQDIPQKSTQPNREASSHEQGNRHGTLSDTINHKKNKKVEIDQQLADNNNGRPADLHLKNVPEKESSTRLEQTDRSIPPPKMIDDKNEKKYDFKVVAADQQHADKTAGTSESKGVLQGDRESQKIASSSQEQSNRNGIESNEGEDASMHITTDQCKTGKYEGKSLEIAHKGSNDSNAKNSL